MNWEAIGAIGELIRRNSRGDYIGVFCPTGSVKQLHYGGIKPTGAGSCDR